MIGLTASAFGWVSKTEAQVAIDNNPAYPSVGEVWEMPYGVNGSIRYEILSVDHRKNSDHFRVLISGRNNFLARSAWTRFVKSGARRVSEPPKTKGAY